LCRCSPRHPRCGVPVLSSFFALNPLHCIPRGCRQLNLSVSDTLQMLVVELRRERVARPGRRRRRVCTGTRVHHENTVRERVARPGRRGRRVRAIAEVHRYPMTKRCGGVEKRTPCVVTLRSGARLHAAVRAVRDPPGGRRRRGVHAGAGGPRRPALLSAVSSGGTGGGGGCTEADEEAEERGVHGSRRRRVYRGGGGRRRRRKTISRLSKWAKQRRRTRTSRPPLLK